MFNCLSRVRYYEILWEIKIKIRVLLLWFNIWLISGRNILKSFNNDDDKNENVNNSKYICSYYVF